MGRFNAFQDRVKRDFDVEKAVALAELKEGSKFKMKDFEIYYASKFESEFAIIETDSGKLYSTWSKVIIEGLNKMLDQRAEMQEVPYELQYIRKTSITSGREYENLKSTE